MDETTYWWQDPGYHLSVYPSYFTGTLDVCAWIVGVFREARHVGNIAAVCAEMYQRSAAEDIAKRPEMLDEPQRGIDDQRDQPRQNVEPLAPRTAKPIPPAKPWWSRDDFELAVIGCAGGDNDRELISAAIVVQFERRIFEVIMVFPVADDCRAVQAMYSASLMLERFRDGTFDAPEPKSVIDWRGIPEPRDSAVDIDHNDQMTEHFYEAHHEFAETRKLVRTHCDHDSILRIVFETMTFNEIDADRILSAPLLRALALFDWEPFEEQQRILNGWNPELFDFSETDLSCNASPSPVLVVDAPEQNRTWDPIAVRWAADLPVQLMLAVGTTRDVALTAMSQLMSDVRDRWDDIISGKAGAA